MTYSLSLEFTVDDSTNKTSTVWRIRCTHGIGITDDIQDFLCLCVAIGLTVRCDVVLVGLSSLSEWWSILVTVNPRQTYLVGYGTTKELMADLSLVLFRVRGVIVVLEHA